MRAESALGGENKVKSMLLVAASAGAIAWSGAAIAQSGKSLAEDAAAFGARPAVLSPDLSADGTRVVYLTPGKGAIRVAVVGDLASGGFKQIAASSSKPETLRWCAFAGPDRYVCKVTAISNRLDTTLIGFSRLISLNGEGKDLKPLGQRDSGWGMALRQFDADVVDWLGGDTGTLLLVKAFVPGNTMGTRLSEKKSGLGVDRVDVASLRKQTVEDARDGATDYMSDGRGNVRIMQVTADEPGGILTGKVRYFYRAQGSKEWLPFAEGLVDYEDFQPLAVDADSNRLYVLIKQNGRMQLYAIQLDATAARTLVAQNPRVDVDDVVRVSDGGPVIGYTFAEEKRDVVYTNAEYKNLAAALGKALPNSPIVSFVDASKDGRKLLLFAGSDVDPGRYYLFDRDKKALTPAMIERPELEGRQLAQVEAVSIPAPDGVSIPAYLTLPPGGKRTGLPAVVLPHGGPSSRDEWGFDWLPQFLAARGYAVVQPQFRGSAGYGDA